MRLLFFFSSETENQFARNMCDSARLKALSVEQMAKSIGTERFCGVPLWSDNFFQGRAWSDFLLFFSFALLEELKLFFSRFYFPLNFIPILIYCIKYVTIPIDSRSSKLSFGCFKESNLLF